MKKTIVYIIRHGEVANPNHIIYNRLPGFGLSDRGRYQAARIGEWLKEKKISAVYTSPLQRTRETAEIIAGKELPLIIVPDITEANYKKWEGLTASERNAKDVEIYVKCPDKLNLGERLSEIEERMIREIMKIVRKNRGRAVAVVSHADPILVTRLSFEKKPLAHINRYEVRNASVTTLEFASNDKFLKSSYNQIVAARKDMP